MRPRHHITVSSGWLNDPNGLSWRDGIYHLFHQYHAARPVWGTIEWAHLTSPDLVHWTRQPVALSPRYGPDVGQRSAPAAPAPAAAPTDLDVTSHTDVAASSRSDLAGSVPRSKPDATRRGAPDADGCWSGCMVFDGDRPTAVYTGVEQLGPREWTQTVCLARGDRALLRFERDPASPVLAGPPPGLDTVGFRDPFVWREGDGWALIVGTGIRGEGGAVLLFRSPDLLDWRYEGPIYSRRADDNDPVWTGRMWECPQLLPFEDRHILIFSVWDDEQSRRLHYPIAAIGTFDGRHFAVDHLQPFDHGDNCYAPAAFIAPDGRLLAWGWAWEALTDDAQLAQGWAGCLTYPRELSITPAGQLGIAPARELTRLRREHATLGPLTLSAEPVHSPIAGDVLDIQARIRPGAAERIVLSLCTSPDRAEHTLLTFTPGTRRLELHRDHSSLLPGALGGSHGGCLDLAADEPLDVRVLIDRSIVEVFANGRFALTERIYPTRPDSSTVTVHADAAPAQLDRLDVWTC